MAEPLDGLWEQEELIEELRDEAEMGRVMTFVAQSGTVSETFEARDDDEIEGVDALGGDLNYGVGLEDQEARFEVGVAVPSQVQVNGVVLTLDSPPPQS